MSGRLPRCIAALEIAHRPLAQRGDFRRRQLRKPAVFRREHETFARGNGAECLLEAGTDRKPGAGNMPVPLSPAEREVENRCGAARDEVGEARGIDSELGALTQSRNVVGRRAPLLACLRQDEHVAKSHLTQP